MDLFVGFSRSEDPYIQVLVWWSDPLPQRSADLVPRFFGKTRISKKVKHGEDFPSEFVFFFPSKNGEGFFSSKEVVGEKLTNHFGFLLDPTIYHLPKKLINQNGYPIDLL